MKNGILAGVIALVLAAPAAAQVPGINLSLFPRVGVYQPLGDLGDLSAQQSASSVKLAGGPAIGLSAELSLPILPFGVRANLDYALGMGAKIDGGEADDAEHTVLALTVDAVLRLAPGISPIQPYLLGGIGTRKYDFDESGPEDQSNAAFHLGAGLGFKLGPLSLVAEVSDYLSQFQFAGADKKLQNDVFIMAGFKIGMF